MIIRFARRWSLPVEQKYIRRRYLLFILLLFTIRCGNDALVDITQPADGALVNGSVEIITQPAGSSPVDSIQFFIDDELMATSLPGSNAYLWDTRSLEHLSVHNISVIAFFANGLIAESDIISVTIYTHRTVLAEVFGEYV